MQILEEEMAYHHPHQRHPRAAGRRKVAAAAAKLQKPIQHPLKRVAIVAHKSIRD